MKCLLIPTQFSVCPERQAWWGLRWVGSDTPPDLRDLVQSLFYDKKLEIPEGPALNRKVLLRSVHAAALSPESESLCYALSIKPGSLRVDSLIDWDETLAENEIAHSTLLQSLNLDWREPAIETLQVMTLGDWVRLDLGHEDPGPDISDEPRTEWPESLSPDEVIAAEQIEKSLGRKLSYTEVKLVEQSWSEHCRHKIFRADIEIEDCDLVVHSLLQTYLRGPAQSLKAARVESMFHDNAGVLRIWNLEGQPTEWAVALKMETHNSPSAIAPKAGASTGLVGVHRDILGVGRGAKPIFNWNVLCVESQWTQGPRPESALSSDQVRWGVIAGIQEGGNHSGVPTLAGSFVSDPSYAVKPAVFAGAAGLIPRDQVQKLFPEGQSVYILGGATGRDGLGGAVMSSRDLRASDHSGLSVQVANPFVQRRLTEFLMAARDAGLIEAITDNGAGGLASSLGELGELAGGLDVDLASLRLKFSRLQSWEKFLSESQERMTVFTTQSSAFEDLARQMGIAWDRLGRTNNTRRFVVRDGLKVLVDLPFSELFESCPRLKLRTSWTLEQDRRWVNEKRDQRRRDSSHLARVDTSMSPSGSQDWKRDFETLLRSEDLCSRRRITERFDHEVQGRTLKKPFQGWTQSTPGDGVLCEVPEAQAVVCLGHGLAPQRLDIHENVLSSLDEALKHFVLAGGRLESAALLDNFSWADPTGPSADSQRRLWRLWRTAKCLEMASRTWKLPFISGKDSMKNNSGPFSQPETLVVTCAGSGRNPSLVPSGFFCRPNDVVFWLPPFTSSWQDSALDRMVGLATSPSASTLSSLSLSSPKLSMLALSSSLQQLDQDIENLLTALWSRYLEMETLIAQGLLRAAKDLSEGGLLMTVFEMCLGRELGFLWEESPGSDHLKEGLGSFVVAVDPHFSRLVEKTLPQAKRLGVVLRPFQWEGMGSTQPLSHWRDLYEMRGREGYFG